MSNANKRSSPRKTQNCSAKLLCGANGAEVDCTLKDISATGACLRLPPDHPYFAVQWPKQVTLQIAMDRVEVDCVLVRRSKSDLAVRFTGAFRSLVRGARTERPATDLGAYAYFHKATANSPALARRA